MKKIFGNIVFLIGAIVTLGAIIVCGVLAKNLGEFFDRGDDL